MPSQEPRISWFLSEVFLRVRKWSSQPGAPTCAPTTKRGSLTGELKQAENYVLSLGHL